MIRHLRIVLLVAVAAVAGTACTSASDAAVVNGVTITDAEVTGLRTAPVGAAISGEQFRNDLSTVIVLRASLDAAEEDYGITGLETEEARQTYVLGAPESEINIVTSVASNPELTEAAVNVVITQLMLRSAVFDAIGNDPAVLEIVWQQAGGFMMEVCASHILVASQAEAVATMERIEAGEAFSVVADEVSLDAASAGGQLPCPTSPTDYVAPFANAVAIAPVGEVTEPFETEFGWHLALVESRIVPASYDEFAAEPERWIPSAVIAESWTTWSDAALARADIEVRSQIGRWFPQGDGIAPPPGSP